MSRDAKCPYELSVLVKRPQRGREFFIQPPTTFFNGETRLNTPLPLTPQPVQLPIEQVINDRTRVPRESFGEASALIGDQRVYITVPMLLLRWEADPYANVEGGTPNGQHPADVTWFRDAGRAF